ncbi:relaxase/mobilization nuclease domain-containing protein [Chitinophaga horti]|uniref:Relaxase/mobilization nuclease domain-containing protein n=1 Tax=Chitinophaga horti TaxID=2920382 RepID=A0ABY6IY43_9BACT|nr:relaxase/mobilization nuclease domain-containing protein [Chitinophaga horti]UYQ92188.1 relaxase/mobilization nuclease domain-containing protein [Chitinophaga horti]
MVTIIDSSTRIKAILNYNEKKVEKGVAVCLGAMGYPKDLPDLSFTQKINRLLNQAALRPSVKKPGVHISINFDPSEKLPGEKLLQIAADYMQGIGFADQPYLIYQHHDSGHPHLHIVTINIDRNGKPLQTSNIGRGKSEKTRLALEEKYGLVRAQDADKKRIHQPKSVDVRQAIYGQTDSRTAIAKVLNAVINTYNYTSLAELNALLRQYNVSAERGGEDSRVFKTGGLLYHIIDQQGNKVGKPIKASRFFNNPTLTRLQEIFTQNERYRKHHRAEKTKLANTLGLLLLDTKCNTLEKLISSLKAEGIDTVIRQNLEGRIYGITFIDNRTRHVFNGSQVGQAYSASAILKHFDQCSSAQPSNHVRNLPFPDPPLNLVPPTPPVSQKSDLPALNILETLLQPEYNDLQLPWHLRIGKKKKKRGRRGQTKI